MKKTILLLALLAAVPTSALDLYPAHEVSKLAWASVNPQTVLEGIVIAVTTTSTTSTGIVMVSDSGTQSAPTTDGTLGFALTGVQAVSVILKTSSNATAGGTLQCYIWNAAVANWARVPDLDLTAIATTYQSWPSIYVPVSAGRVIWIPNGIGSVTTSVYVQGQPR